MVTLKTSGDQATWLNRVANRIMDGGDKPPSLSSLYVFVPQNMVTARNDGHVTAGESLGENHRDDYKAGWKIIIDEMLGILRKQGFVNDDDNALRWLKPVDGEWHVKVGDKLITVRGQRERRMSRERHILGESPAIKRVVVEETSEPLGLIQMGQSAGFDVDIVGERGAVRRENLMVHPYAFLIPPMTAVERESFRSDVEERGIRVPLVLYPDATDLTPNGKPKLKVLDGRHRLYYAAQLKKPVRVEIFNGDDNAARKEIVSLNIKRRHLTLSLHQVTALLMFGDEAKKEAKEAKIEGNQAGGMGGKSTPNIDKPNQPTIGGRWEDRVVEKAHAAGLVNVTKHGITQAERIVAAPETLARVQSGDLGKPIDAFNAATEELGGIVPVLPETVTLARLDVIDPQLFIRWCRSRLSGSHKPMSIDDLRAYRQALDELISEIESR